VCDPGAMNTPDAESLRQFFGAYFHQDWRADAPDTASVISSYLADHPDKAERDKLARLIVEYSLRAPNEESLEYFLFKEFCCYYTPSADGVPVRDWLAGIAMRLREG
jgi:hypothetical protein